MIIALHGKAGSGKSTAFEALRANSGGVPVALAKFAAPLYALQEAAYRIIEPVYTRPEDFVKDRKFLQFVGTDWGRGIKDTIWVDLWKARVTMLTTRDPELVVITDDCRFDNEVEVVHGLGGVVVEIICNRDGFEVGGIPNHASEGGINDELVDYTISNNGTIEEFQEELKVLFAKIKEDLATPKPVMDVPMLEEDDFLPIT